MPGRRGDDLNRRRLLRRVSAGGAAGAGVVASIAGVLGEATLAAPLTQLASATLRLNAGSEPITIDPQLASFTNEIDKIMRVFRNLLRYDVAGRLVPDQAVALPVVADGGRLLTFTLKPGLTYSDGRPLTAADFEYGWKRHLEPAIAGQYAFAGYVVEGAEAYNNADANATPADRLQALRDAVGVTALDDRTLQFRLVVPAPWFIGVLATWCGVPTRQDMVEQGGARWTEPATYVGNGPYVLAEWEHHNRMQFKANPRFLPAPPPIQTVEYAMIGEPNVAFAAYMNDELDLIVLQREDKPRVDGNPTLAAQFRQYPGSCTYYVGFNTRLAPFDNQKVRAAFSLAIDRDDFVATGLGGQGLPARQFLPPTFPGHYEGDLEPQAFDPAAGRRLIAEAGFAAGRGLPAIKFGYSANPRTKVRVDAIAAQIKRSIGVDVQPDPLDARAYASRLKEQQTVPQMFLLGWCQDYPDPQNWYSTVFSSKATISHTGWSHPEFDRLTGAGDVETDPAVRREQYRQAAQLLIDDAPVAFLWHAVTWVLVKPRVAGFREDPLERFLGEHDLYNLQLTE